MKEITKEELNETLEMIDKMYEFYDEELDKFTFNK